MYNYQMYSQENCDLGIRKSDIFPLPQKSNIAPRNLYHSKRNVTDLQPEVVSVKRK